VKTRVCVAGITGWVGKPLAMAISASEDMTLSAGVSRAAADEDIGRVLGIEASGLKVRSNLRDALDEGVDVVIDYTHPSAIEDNIDACLDAHVPIVVGTSGVTPRYFETLDSRAREADIGVIVSGNFSLTASLLQYLAIEAAHCIDQKEIVDYAHSRFPQVPSGTARELAGKISEVSGPAGQRDLRPGASEHIVGPVEGRGALIDGIHVHSVRSLGYTLSVEVIYANTAGRLTLRVDSDSSPEPYIHGTLLATRRVREVKGLVVGLDSLLFRTPVSPLLRDPDNS